MALVLSSRVGGKFNDWDHIHSLVSSGSGESSDGPSLSLALLKDLLQQLENTLKQYGITNCLLYNIPPHSAVTLNRYLSATTKEIRGGVVKQLNKETALVPLILHDNTETNVLPH